MKEQRSERRDDSTTDTAEYFGNRISMLEDQIL